MFYNNGYNQDWSTLKKLVWLRGNPATGQMGTDLTVSGTPPLSLPNSLGKPLKAWEVDVLPKQDLNGYDAPWPAGGGANKFDGEWNDASSGWRYSKNYFPVTENLTYYGCTSNISDDYVYIAWYDSEYTQIGSIVNFRNSTITAPAGAAFAKLQIWYDRDPTDIAINYPSTVTTYSPYSNICPIHGTDKLTVTTAGSNIFDFAQLANEGTNPVAVDNGYQFLLNGVQYSTGVPVSYGINRITVSAYVKCITATNIRFRLAFSDGTFQDGTGTSATEPTLLTMTSYVNKQVVAIRLNWSQTGSCEVTNFMVNIGTDALPYEPYSASQTVLTLPQTVYAGTIGSDGGESRTGCVTIVKSDVFSVNIDGPNLRVTLNNDKLSIFNRYKNGRCNKAVVLTSWASVSGNANGIAVNSADNKQFIVNSAIASDMQGILDFIGDDGLQIETELVAPAQFAVTSPTIPTPTGTATTWATAEDGIVDGMEVTYVGKA